MGRALQVIEAESPREFLRRLPAAGLIDELERHMAQCNRVGWHGAAAETRMMIEYLRATDPAIRREGADKARDWIAALLPQHTEMKALLQRVAATLDPQQESAKKPARKSAKNFIKDKTLHPGSLVYDYRTNRRYRIVKNMGTTKDGRTMYDCKDKQGFHVQRWHDDLQLIEVGVLESAKDFIMNAGIPEPDWGEVSVARDEHGRALEWRWYAKHPPAVLFLNYEGHGRYSAALKRLDRSGDYLTSMKVDDSYVWSALTITHAEYQAKEMAKEILAGKRKLEAKSPREFFKGLGVGPELDRLIAHYDALQFHATAGKLRVFQHLLQHPEDYKQAAELAKKYSYSKFPGAIAWLDDWMKDLENYLPRPGHDHARRVYAILLKLKQHFLRQHPPVAESESEPGSTRSFIKSLAPPFWFDEFLNAYEEAALWSSLDDEDRPLDSIDAELSDEAKAEMKADCLRFVLAHRDDIIDNVGQAGHDFWLTRNGHGAGFWDGDWPEEVGERLTKASEAFGEVYLYVGDDGQIYQG